MIVDLSRTSRLGSSWIDKLLLIGSVVLFATGLWLLNAEPAKLVSVDQGSSQSGVAMEIRVFSSAEGIDGGVSSASVPQLAGADAGVAAELQPLPGARVRVYYEFKNETYAWLADVKTQASGVARISELPRGAFYVLVQAEGFERVSRPLRLTGNVRVDVELASARHLSVTVRDDTQQPISGATVLVHSGDLVPFGALTDETGRAHFHRLGRAPYRVDAYARGFEAGRQQKVDQDVEFELRRLGGFRLTVVGPDGARVPNAEISVVGSTLWPARRVAANDQGQAKLSGLLPGAYDIKAESGALVSELVSGVRLERGERKTLQLRLQVGRTVLVHVRHNDGFRKRSIEGASVVLADYGVTAFPLTGTTDKQGVAQLGPVAPGPAYVSVRANGFVGQSAVPVPEVPTGPLEVTLLRASTLVGRVVDGGGRPIAGAQIEVVGSDLDGSPVAETPLLAAYRSAHFAYASQPLSLIPKGELGVTIGHLPFVGAAIQGTGFDTLPEDYRPWLSDYTGAFRASPVPPGKLRALVRHPAYVETLSELVTLAPGGQATVEVVLLEGAKLQGRLVDARGHPVSGGRVRASGVRGSFDRSVFSAEDGTFSISAVPNLAVVALSRPDDLQRFVSREVVSFEPGETRTLEFVLPEAREATRVRVLDQKENPVELAQVTFLSVDPKVPLRSTRFTGRDGTVEFEDVRGLAARISVQAPGFVAAEKQLKQMPEKYEWVLQPGVVVTGIVTAVRGRVEVQAARVRLWGGGRSDSTLTDSRGRFEFRNVPPGETQLIVTHADYAAQRRTFIVRSTARDDRAFEFEPIDLEEGGAISGVVLNAEEQPAVGARVGLEFLSAFLPRGRLPEGVAITGIDGRFVLPAVASGKQTVYAFARGAGRAQEVVELTRGGRREVRMVLDGQTSESHTPPGLAGVAVTLGEREHEGVTQVIVVSVAAASEALRAGLRAGDIVLSVDGLAPASASDARQRLSGREASDVVIEVDRGGKQEPYRVRRELVSN